MRRQQRSAKLIVVLGFWMIAASSSFARPFDFERDTFAFANETVFEYHEGHASLRQGAAVKQRRFVQHCFVMSRSVVQFRKFARFNPSQPPLNDLELSKRIRKITHSPTWNPPLPEAKRIVIPGYRDLRSLSSARGEVVRTNIGLGWPTYFRVGNWRIVLPHGGRQQAETEQDLEQALQQQPEGFFVAYLTTFPRSLSINHAVLVYKKELLRGNAKTDRISYLVYDPNHADLPRKLDWSPSERSFSYQADSDFVGGHVIVWQVYGRPLQ